jgi:hypothetical protein
MRLSGRVMRVPRDMSLGPGGEEVLRWGQGGGWMK